MLIDSFASKKSTDLQQREVGSPSLNSLQQKGNQTTMKQPLGNVCLISTNERMCLIIMISQGGCVERWFMLWTHLIFSDVVDEKVATNWNISGVSSRAVVSAGSCMALDSKIVQWVIRSHLFFFFFFHFCKKTVPYLDNFLFFIIIWESELQ